MMICLQELRKINFMVHNICRFKSYLTFVILQEYLENSYYVILTKMHFITISFRLTLNLRVIFCT